MEDKSTEKEMNKNLGSEVKLQDIFELISGMSKKMDKLDIIQENMENIQTELKEVRKSIEYAHSEIDDLKKENEKKAQVQRETTERINKLEADNITLLNSVIDLKARSMRDNLLFYNMPEESDENTTAMIHKLLEEKLGFEDAAMKIKIDRSHRLGKKKQGETKAQPIVAKFNFHQDKVSIMRNAKKLKGTGSRIEISEQFPEEIARERKRLYPEFKKARRNNLKATLVRDKLFINGELFRG
jgi:hypothetical protein